MSQQQDSRWVLRALGMHVEMTARTLTLRTKAATQDGSRAGKRFWSGGGPLRARASDGVDNITKCGVELKVLCKQAKRIVEQKSKALSSDFNPRKAFSHRAKSALRCIWLVDTGCLLFCLSKPFTFHAARNQQVQQPLTARTASRSTCACKRSCVFVCFQILEKRSTPDGLCQTPDCLAVALCAWV